MLRSHIKNFLFSPLFWVCSIILAAAMSLGVYEDLQAARSNSISIIYCWIVTNSVGVAHVLLPVLTTVPFTFYYVDRLEKKAVYYTMIRSSTKDYYLSEVIAAILSSVLVTFVACIIFITVCIMSGARDVMQDTITDYFSGTWFAYWSEQGAYNKILLIHILDYLLYSLPWTLFGMVVSLFCKNKYVIVAAPFICFMLLSYVTEMLSVTYLNPGTMLLKGNIRSTPGGGILCAAIYFIGLSGIMGAWYYLSSRRRMKYEGI